MATNNSSKATDKAILGKIPVACHQHDDWLVPAAKNDPNAQFASEVMDVARGSRVIASILCAHIVGSTTSASPLLSLNDTEALARLAVVSLNHLYELSERQVERLNDKAKAGSPA